MVSVRQEEECSRSLLCYTRQPTSREEANNADIAFSMHLALRSTTDGSWYPLNDNYGIFFAAGVPVEGVPQSARVACTAARRFVPEPKVQEVANPGLSHHDHSRQAKSAISSAIDWDAVMPGVDIVLKSLINPWLFRLVDGRFGIIATRTDRDGQPDGSERDSFLVAVSKDLRSFDRLGQIHIKGANGVHRPRAVWDESKQCYLIFCNDSQGQLACAAMTDLDMNNAFSIDLVAVDSDVIALDPDQSLKAADFPIADVHPCNIVAITECEAEVLEGRFGRMYNTAVSVEPLHVHADTVYQLREQLTSVQAQLRYSDGSTAMRGIEIDKNQLALLEAAWKEEKLQPGFRCHLRGRVRQQLYPVPFARERADPSMVPFTWNGRQFFMFMATEDEGGNCVDPRGGHTHMPLRVAESIADLSDESGGRVCEIDLLKCGDCNSEGRRMTGCFWAPELHIIGGRLSVLFMPCFDGELTNPDGSANTCAGKPDMWTGSCHIMQLRKDRAGQDLDPRNPSNWDSPRPILCKDGSPLNPVERISLDMTVIEDSGTCYYAWQQVGSIWIARFDPAVPDRVISLPRQIIVPEFAWDNMIAEGPNAVVHDGRIFLIYSGSLVGIDYTTGLATAPSDQGVDLTDAKNWTKLDYPLQKSSIYNGSWQLGTGHGMWSRDEDGHQLYVFHNAEYSEGEYRGRDTQVRRVHWSEEGMPVLDMQCNEELNTANSKICVEVNI
ncbi:family 43 glycosylhydrolase [Bombiscardovia coagulans]|uniref:Alpha-arabinofuranosidase n=1 Tax=Bombiscardovia coagulans TaxID=686666 RepID=A0A261EU88_9BIFI|nr:family 43 glycosylhydrolase [Bombiscardovia coagulans]OZG50395.1 alpha-arabinofuranosidase [Bombiscardovia coagulans]